LHKEEVPGETFSSYSPAMMIVSTNHWARKHSLRFFSRFSSFPACQILLPWLHIEVGFFEIFSCEPRNYYCYWTVNQTGIDLCCCCSAGMTDRRCFDSLWDNALQFRYIVSVLHLRFSGCHSNKTL